MLESHLHERRPWHRCFAVNFAKFLRTPFVTENLRVTASKCHPHTFMFRCSDNLFLGKRSIQWCI